VVYAAAPATGPRGHDLILFDGRPEHIIVDGDHVTGIIDLAEVCPGDAAMDLAVLAVTDPACWSASSWAISPPPANSWPSLS
jgi:aminoglycoside phosphotransferase (APT) family kinase protein